MVLQALTRDHISIYRRLRKIVRFLIWFNMVRSKNQFTAQPSVTILAFIMWEQNYVERTYYIGIRLTVSDQLPFLLPCIHDGSSYVSIAYKIYIIKLFKEKFDYDMHFKEKLLCIIKTKSMRLIAPFVSKKLQKHHKHTLAGFDSLD